MKTEKTCPHCGSVYEGRSNQRYCSSRCKGAAFREGTVVTTAEKRESDESLAVLVPYRSKVDETSLKLFGLRLDSAERMRQMELEELDRQRRFEAEQQERNFQREQERESRQATAQKAELQQERTTLEEKLRSFEVLLAKPTLQPHTEEEADEEEPEAELSETGISPWWWVVGGLALLAMLNNSQPKTTPVPQKRDEGGFPPPNKPGGNGL